MRMPNGSYLTPVCKRTTRNFETDYRFALQAKHNLVCLLSGVLNNRSQRRHATVSHSSLRAELGFLAVMIIASSKEKSGMKHNASHVDPLTAQRGIDYADILAQ